jgi:hypothetical protein
MGGLGPRKPEPPKTTIRGGGIDDAVKKVPASGSASDMCAKLQLHLEFPSENKGNIHSNVLYIFLYYLLCLLLLLPCPAGKVAFPK